MILIRYINEILLVDITIKIQVGQKLKKIELLSTYFEDSIGCKFKKMM